MESTVVTSTRVTSAGIEQTSVSRVRMTPAMLAAAPVGPIALKDVRSVVEVREAERSELRELNERFASCIEKVRFLEEENARIVEQLAELRQTGAEGTEQVRQEYSEQLEALRAQLEESEVAKGELDVRLTILTNKSSSVLGLVESAHLDSAADGDHLQQLEHLIEERKVELDSLRTRITNFDEERSTDLAEIDRLKTEVERLSTELEQEALAHVKVENQRLTLREELEFRKEAFDTELKELTAIAFRGSTAEVRDFWKAELADAILDVRFEYEKNIETAKLELETLFSIRSESGFSLSISDSSFSAVGRIKEDNERLKTEVSDLRKQVPAMEKRHAELEVQIAEITTELDSFRSEADMERMTLDHELSEVRFELTSMLEELRTQMDTRLRLRIEIAAYRKLIEYEEARLFPEKKKELEEKRQKEAAERLPPKKRPVVVEVSHEDEELHDIAEETEDVESEKADTVKEFEVDVGEKDIEHVMVEDSDECEGTKDVTECLEATEVLDLTDVTDTTECVAVEITDEAECTDDVVEITDDAECVAVEITDEAECTDDVVEITGEAECVAEEITDEAECGETEGAVGCDESVEKKSWTSEISEVVEGSATATETAASASEFSEAWEQEFVSGFQSRKTKSKKKFKGNVQIKEVSADGSYVVIQNKSSKKQDIGDWVLKRDHDSGRRVIDFSFPAGTFLEGNGVIKIWAKGARPASSSEPECRFPTWGFGSMMAVCSLSTASGEEKANHTEKAS